MKAVGYTRVSTEEQAKEGTKKIKNSPIRRSHMSYQILSIPLIFAK